MLPFSREQFFGIFEVYNRAVYPAQIALLLLALLCVLLASRPRLANGRWIAAGLALLWLWMGAVYHIRFFTRINPAAYLFGALFVGQALLLLAAAAARTAPAFRAHRDLRGAVGGFLVLYALVLYPLLGTLAGQSYPRMPTFGLPCPTTIFTFGVLLWAETRVPLRLVLIPLLWSLIGGSATIVLGVPEDAMLPVAGVAGTLLLLLGQRRPAAIAQPPAGVPH